MAGRGRSLRRLRSSGSRICKTAAEGGEIFAQLLRLHAHFTVKSSFLELYDARGGAEVEQFRNDKSGLSMEARRKHNFLGQKGYILLTDLAHNLLADFYNHALVGTRFSDFGPKRIVRDLLAIPGRLVFVERRLTRVELLSQNKFAKDLAMCLLRYGGDG